MHSPPHNVTARSLSKVESSARFAKLDSLVDRQTRSRILSDKCYKVFPFFIQAAELLFLL